MKNNYFSLSGQFLLTLVSVASFMISWGVLNVSLFVILEIIPMEGQFFSAKPGKKKDIKSIFY